MKRKSIPLHNRLIHDFNAPSVIRTAWPLGPHQPLLPTNRLPVRLPSDQRVPEPLLLPAVRRRRERTRGSRQFVVATVGAGTVGGHDQAGATQAATNKWVDHGEVADDDGDEGFAAGPAAGLLGAVCTSLCIAYRLATSVVWNKEGGGERTVTINTQRRIPAAMTKIPPLNMRRSSHFSRMGRRALKRTCFFPFSFSLLQYSHVE